jgi:predicted phosphoribosyltransferase
VLEPDELEAVQAFHGEMQGKSDEEVAEQLNRRAQEEGFG